MTAVPEFKVKGLKLKLEEAITGIITGVTEIKEYFVERPLLGGKRDGKHILPTMAEIGHLIPFKCGHRAFPKERERERRAIDILLKESGYTSPIGCIISSVN